MYYYTICISNVNEAHKSYFFNQIIKPALMLWMWVCLCSLNASCFGFLTSLRNRAWRVYIFTAVCLYVCLSVCLCVCLLVNRILAKRMHRFGRGWMVTGWILFFFFNCQCCSSLLLVMSGIVPLFWTKAFDCIALTPTIWCNWTRNISKHERHVYQFSQQAMEDQKMVIIGLHIL